jgi:hypothetical protein
VRKDVQRVQPTHAQEQIVLEGQALRDPVAIDVRHHEAGEDEEEVYKQV